ncbi:perlucin-like [Mytilus californianus]|uniref:perlucin-like n=1 Tax=Mytilus californianus TaxID=6549 RepID=UPI002246C7FE|nr:perlucin-like [Mytilus californianus]
MFPRISIICILYILKRISASGIGFDKQTFTLEKEKIVIHNPYTTQLQEERSLFTCARMCMAMTKCCVSNYNVSSNICAFDTSGCCYSKTMTSVGSVLIRKVSVEGCRSGWKINNGVYYYISTEYKTWAEAQVYCRQRAGHLAEINDNEENNFIKSVISAGGATGHAVFIGATNSSAGWIWDGNRSPVIYFDWESSQPGGGEHCIALLQNAWHDYGCYEEHGFICESQVY